MFRNFYNVKIPLSIWVIWRHLGSCTFYENSKLYILQITDTWILLLVNWIMVTCVNLQIQEIEHPSYMSPSLYWRQTKSCLHRYIEDKQVISTYLLYNLLYVNYICTHMFIHKRWHLINGCWVFFVTMPRVELWLVSTRVCERESNLEFFHCWVL